MINYKKTYKESTSWRHWRLSCLTLLLPSLPTLVMKLICLLIDPSADGANIHSISILSPTYITHGIYFNMNTASEAWKNDNIWPVSGKFLVPEMWSTILVVSTVARHSVLAKI